MKGDAELTSAVLSHGRGTPLLTCHVLFLIFLQNSYKLIIFKLMRPKLLQMGQLTVEVSGQRSVCGGDVYLCVCVCVWEGGLICSLTPSEMNSVLSHARNVPSVSTHPLTCPTTHYCLEQRQNTALKVL